MSVVYFEAILGKSVISDLGLAQNLPWLAVMLLVYVLQPCTHATKLTAWIRTLSSSKHPSTTLKVNSVLATHMFMLGLCVLFPVLVALDITVRLAGPMLA